MVKKQPDVCELFCYNKSKVNALKKAMLATDKITKLTDIFNVLADSTRIKILFTLSKGELCVCDISHVLGLSISAVSHQLRMLRNLGLVKYRSEGKMAFYSLADKHIISLIAEVLERIEKSR